MPTSKATPPAPLPNDQPVDYVFKIPFTEEFMNTYEFVVGAFFKVHPTGII